MFASFQNLPQFEEAFEVEHIGLKSKHITHVGREDTW